MTGALLRMSIFESCMPFGMGVYVLPVAGAPINHIR